MSKTHPDRDRSRIAMELRQLRYVVAVATHRHFTRAAGAAHVAQPALSHQIKRLETELGVQLFERGRAGVSLTEAGEAFLVRARRALAEVDAAVAEIASLRGLHTGRVVLGAMQALGGLDLPRHIAAFHAAHPGVEISLREESTSDMLALIVTGELDLAIAALDVPRPAQVAASSLLREPVLMVLPASHGLAGQRTVRMEQFRNEPFVFFKRGTGLRVITERAAEAAGFRPHIAFETNNLDRMLALVTEKLGVALVPASSIRAPARSIVAIPLRPPVQRAVGVVWRDGRRHPPAAEAFLASLRPQAQRS